MLEGVVMGKLDDVVLDDHKGETLGFGVVGAKVREQRQSLR
jgi:hypothetical protein